MAIGDKVSSSANPKYKSPYHFDNQVKIGSANVKKPQLAPLDTSLIPMGCSYTIDDWKGNILVYVPIEFEGMIIINVDGQIRNIPMNQGGKPENFSAFDGKYYIEVIAPIWKILGDELSSAKAYMTIINTSTRARSELIVQAVSGC